MASFSYGNLPLQSGNVRLLRPEGWRDSTLSCSLEVVDSIASLQYHALSYTWGDPRPASEQVPGEAQVKHSILLNGRMKKVTNNLYRALVRLASNSPATKAPLWIDALCINQHDPAEKAAQVQRMDDIYKGARTVIAWLGEADDLTEPALEALRRLAAIDSGIVEGDYAAHQQRDLNSYGLNDDQWRGLVAFFCLAWFTRVWVIQEVTFARELVAVWGPHAIDQDTLKHASTYLAQSRLWFRLTRLIHSFSTVPGQQYSEDVPALGAVTGSFAGMGAAVVAGRIHPKLVTLFGRGNKASDSRDQIYAMLGLAKPAAQAQNIPLPAIEYDLEVEVVFTNWAKWMVEDMDNYILFSSVEDKGHRKLNGLPSWVPDMSTSMMPNTFRYLPQHRDWSPSGDDTHGELTLLDGSSIVQTRAAEFDTVVAVSTPFDTMATTRDYRSFAAFIQSLRIITEPYADPLEAVASTMTAGVAAPIGSNPESILVSWVNAWSIGDFASGLSRLGAGIREHVQWFNVSSDQIRRTRRLFRTSRNYIGVAAHSTEKDDQVVVLPGAATPFVFRRTAGEEYKLIGEAYVHGIMAGEAVDLIGENKILPWRTIDIS